ncbi:hypothetical protein IJI76_03695 [Candidatus Saccharibacteria bacterium]|nr:hypothetical protein [Candidatus Saccharibacteria bacterium]
MKLVIGLVIAILIARQFTLAIEAGSIDDDGTVTFTPKPTTKLCFVGIAGIVMYIFYMLGLSNPKAVLWFTAVASFALLLWYNRVSYNIPEMFAPILLSFVGLTFASLANGIMKVNNVAPWIFIIVEALLAVLVIFIGIRHTSEESKELSDDADDPSSPKLRDIWKEIPLKDYLGLVDWKAVFVFIAKSAVIVGLVAGLVYLQISRNFFF